MAPSERLIALGDFARPHGVAGEVKIRLYNEATDVLDRERVVTLRGPNGLLRSARLLRPRRQGKGLVVTVEGHADRDAAERLRGVEICLPRGELPETDADEFYAADLEGAVVDLVPDDGSAARRVGTVLRLVSYPTCDALVVELAPEMAAELGVKPKKRGAPSLEIPLLEAFVARVDAKAGLVLVRTLEGLEA